MQLLAASALLIGLSATAVLAGSRWYLKTGKVQAFELRPKTAQELQKEAEYEKLIAGGEFYKPLKLVVDYPGVTAPDMLNADAVELPASTEIVGVEINGEFCAFVLNSMLSPRKHIVNLVIDESPLSVTYCNLVDCVRVLTREGNGAIPLSVGGLDVDNQLVLLLGDLHYGQSSPGLPLNDYPFDRMTWGKWKAQHPTTKIYVGKG